MFVVEVVESPGQFRWLHSHWKVNIAVWRTVWFPVYEDWPRMTITRTLFFD